MKGRSIPSLQTGPMPDHGLDTELAAPVLPRATLLYPGPFALGGAETLVLGLAEALTGNYEVEILTGTFPSTDLIEHYRSITEPGTPTRLVWTAPRNHSARSYRRHSRQSALFACCDPFHYPRPPRDAVSLFLAWFAPELVRPSLPARMARSAASVLYPRRPVWPDPPGAIREYHAVIVISQWVASLAEAHWGRPVHVVHPPVRQLQALAKTKTILSVGRFWHSKRHDLLIEAFRALALPDWQLVIAGSAPSDNTLSHLRELARGLAVSFVVDPSRSELEQLFGMAGIYWHAAGAGITDLSSVEHFGIAVAEAMSASTAVCAFRSAGVPEVVGEEAGVVWETERELVQATLKLAEDDSYRENLGRLASERARDFAPERFRQKIRTIVTELTSHQDRPPMAND